MDEQERLEKLTEGINLSAEQMELLTKRFHEFGNVTVVLDKVKKSASGITDSLQDLTNVDVGKYFNNLGLILDSAINKFKEGNNVVPLLANQILGAGNVFDQFGRNAGLFTFSDQLEKVKKELSVLPINELEKLAEKAGLPARKAGQSAKDFAEQVGNSIGKITAGADQLLKVQSELLQVGAATGSLNELYQRGSVDITALNNASKNYIESIRQVSVATGMSMEQTAQYSQQLNKIPGALTQVVDVGSDAGNSMSSLEATMTFARGSGQEFGTVVNDLKKAFDNYGASVEKGLQYSSRISELSRDLKAPIGDVRDYMGKVSDEFKRWGDATEGSARIFNNLYDSFRQTGLSAKEATGIISELTSKVTHLNVAQEAFLSARTGGPGGLQGAFQIQSLLAEGKVDEVLQKMQQSLRQQMGGRIVTVQEAGQDPMAAQMYARQQALISSSAFGGLASDQATQQKIFEVMSKGGDLTQKSLGDVKIGLNDTIKDGNTLQGQTNTILTNILNTVNSFRTQGIGAASDVTYGVSEASQGPGSALRKARVPATEFATAEDRPLTAKPVDLMAKSLDLAGLTKGSISETAKKLYSDYFSLMKSGKAEDSEKAEKLLFEAAQQVQDQVRRAASQKGLSSATRSEMEKRNLADAQFYSALGLAEFIPDEAKTGARAVAAAAGKVFGATDTHAAAPHAASNVVVNVYVDGKNIPSQSQVKALTGAAHR